MTLFEAIRELKEGQAIYLENNSHPIVAWTYGDEVPSGAMSKSVLVSFGYPAYIIDLPKPKITLEEGLRKVSVSPYSSWANNLAMVLRTMPIDWQAEADRAKEASHEQPR